jgi:hypothetical protein
MVAEHFTENERKRSMMPVYRRAATLRCSIRAALRRCTSAPPLSALLSKHRFLNVNAKKVLFVMKIRDYRHRTCSTLLYWADPCARQGQSIGFEKIPVSHGCVQALSTVQATRYPDCSDGYVSLLQYRKSHVILYMCTRFVYDYDT